MRTLEALVSDFAAALETLPWRRPGFFTVVVVGDRIGGPIALARQAMVRLRAGDRLTRQRDEAGQIVACFHHDKEAGLPARAHGAVEVALCHWHLSPCPPENRYPHRERLGPASV